jgi:hypothetical protein
MRAWVSVIFAMAACATPEAARPVAHRTHAASASASSSASATVVREEHPKPAVPTRCQTIESGFEERVRDAFTKANTEALAAVREERDPISKKLVNVRAELAKATAQDVSDRLKAQIATLEQRRTREHPARTDAPLMGLDALRANDLCVEGADAAWATSLTNVEVVPADTRAWDEPVAWTIHAERVVVRDDGTSETSASLAALVGPIPKDGTIVAKRLAPHDLDGDHASEWYVLVGSPSAVATYHLLTFRDGAIRPYASKPPMEITTITSPDKDTIALSHVDWLGDYKPCGTTTTQDVWGPRLAIDVLPDGTFSMSTPAARERNKSFCDDAPEHLFRVDQIVCAKMHGTSTDALAARVRKDDALFDCKTLTRADDPRTFTEEFPFLLKATKLPVPYTK